MCLQQFCKSSGVHGIQYQNYKILFIRHYEFVISAKLITRSLLQCPAGKYYADCRDQQHQGKSTAQIHYGSGKQIFFQKNVHKNDGQQSNTPEDQIFCPQYRIILPFDGRSIQRRQLVDHKIALDIGTDKKCQPSSQCDPVHIRMNQHGNQI